jgi:hypothetical protein
MSQEVSHTPGRERAQALRRRTLTVAGSVAAAAGLAALLIPRRDEFATAVESAPIWILALAVALQLTALLVRTEAWHACIHAAGGTVERPPVYRASGLSSLASLLNGQVAVAARVAALRHSSPDRSPRVPALIAAEAPIVAIEAGLAALTSFTLVGPLGLPWWVPLALVGAATGIATGLGMLARTRRKGAWSGIAIMRSVRGRNRIALLILVAVVSQIARNWLVLHALGLDVSVFDATALLIAMVTLSQLPIGPSVGAVASVIVLGPHGVATVAAAGVLLTATGTAGSLCYAAWALVSGAAHRARRVPPIIPQRLPVPAPGIPR